MPDPIKKQLIRQWDDLSPHELRTVHDLIDMFKGPTDRANDEEHERGTFPSGSFGCWAGWGSGRSGAQ